MKRTLKCKVGDLAVIVDAYNKGNLGKIVKVVDTYSPEKAAWLANPDRFDWIVECPTPMIWSNGEDPPDYRLSGPAPDHALQPIRGLGSPLQQQHSKRGRRDCGEPTTPSRAEPALS